MISTHFQPGFGAHFTSRRVIPRRIKRACLRGDGPPGVITLPPLLCLRVPLKFSRVLAEFLPNRVPNGVLYVVHAIIIVTDVLSSKSFDVDDTPFQLRDRCFDLRDGSELPDVWGVEAVVLGGVRPLDCSSTIRCSILPDYIRPLGV